MDSSIGRIWFDPRPSLSCACHARDPVYSRVCSCPTQLVTREKLLLDRSSTTRGRLQPSLLLYLVEVACQWVICCCTEQCQGAHGCTTSSTNDVSLSNRRYTTAATDSWTRPLQPPLTRRPGVFRCPSSLTPRRSAAETWKENVIVLLWQA